MDVEAVLTQSRRGSRAFRATCPGLILAGLLSLAAWSGPARAADSAVADVLPAFNALCDQLVDGRRALQTGRLAEDGFVDLVLDLFTRADSLSQLLAARVPATRGYSTATALARGLRYLKASLRSNYEGIADGDGYNFVAADLDFQAALAWRNGIAGVALNAR